MRRRLGLLLAGCCSPAFLAPAHAQPEPPSSPGFEEIIVTARRRPEQLQQVPVSVVSLSAEELEDRSVTNLRSLQRFVPNLTFAPSQNVGETAGNAFIRGIGQEDFGVGAEPGVGVYVDGVYFARPLGTLMDVLDVERIEVLRGPQGTLFGKNTIGGAINIVSAGPGPDREQRASLILGNPGRAELRAVANQPLSDRLSVRLSAALVRRDGLVKRLAPPAPLELIEDLNQAPADLGREGSERNLSGRAQLRWFAADDWTVDLSLDGSRRRGSQGATHLDAINASVGILPQINQLIADGVLPGPAIGPGLVRESLFESYAAGRNSARQDFWGAAAKVTRALGGGGQLSVHAAYRGMRNRLGTDTDGLWFGIADFELRADQQQFSGEAQLAGTRGRLDYTAGLFLFHERSKLLPDQGFSNRMLYTCGCFYAPGSLPPFLGQTRDLAGTSYAVYGQGSYGLTERLSVTLGARLSHERKRISGAALRLGTDLRPTGEIAASGANRGRWTPVTWRAGVEYQASPDLMAYASAARGYKSGGFNVRGVIGLPELGLASFKPESALTYEGGLRSEWLGRRLRLNATLFHTDYRDIQLRQQTIAGGIVTTLIENAARGRIRGTEFELAAVLGPSLTLSAAYGHLDARYLDVGLVPGLTLDSRFQRTPRHSFTTSVDFERPLGAGTLELHGDFSYRSSEQFQITPAVNDQRGYGLLDARAAYRTADGRWTVALFGTNLADVRYRAAGRGTLLDQAGVAYSTVGLPRQVGLQATRKF